MKRLTNIGLNGKIWITDNDETRRFGKKESAYKKLAEYEDLEEQGLLLRLPCKVGDTVYVIAPNYEKCEHKTECEDYSDEFLVSWCKVHCRNGYRGMGIIPTIVKRVEIRETSIYIFTEYGYRDVENFFLTKTEAEQKLKEMESGNNEI